MTNYQEASVKVTNRQTNKLKSIARNKTGTLSRINNKSFQDEEFLYELFIKIRKTTKIRNVIAKNISTDIKHSKGQLSKMI